MKRTKKSPLPDFVDFKFSLSPPSSSDAASQYLRDVQQLFGENVEAAERSRQTQRLFAITSEALFRFAERWEVRSPIRRGERISSAAIHRISAAMDALHQAPGPKTIQKCFEHPDRFQRAGAAMATRQLLCIAIGGLSGMVSIQGATVRLRDAEALAKDVGSSLNSKVTVSELQDALDSALEVTLMRRKREKGKSGA
jgi:hypothetical protein